MREVCSTDDDTGTKVKVLLSVYVNIPVLRSTAIIENISLDKNIVVTQLSSLAIGGLTARSERWYADFTLWTASNSWFREAHWREETLTEVGIDSNGIHELHQGHSSSMSTFSVESQRSFSAGKSLPMGLLKPKDDSDTWLWQVDHNGS